MQPKILHLSTEQATATGPVVKTADVATRRYVKPIIKLGTFRHPKKGWTLDVTPERMQGWIDTNAKMRTAGVTVNLTKDHAKGADAVVGESFELFRDGEWLNAIVEARGEKNIELVEANKNVSVEIDEKVVDGTGNEYPEAITAISIVQKPVIPGQTGFQRIAAGMDDDAPVYFLSTGEPEMKTLLTALVGLAAAAGLTLSADAGEEAAVKTVNELKVKLTGLETEKGDLTKKLSLATEGRKPDTKYLGLACEGIESQIDTLKDVLSDAGVKLLKEELARNEKGEFSKFLLSVESEEDGVAVAKRIVKIVRENLGVAKGVKTGDQGTKHLSAGDDPRAGEDPDAKAWAESLAKQTDAFIKSRYGTDLENRK